MTVPQRSAMLDVWMALGGDGPTFEQWMSRPRRAMGDAWAQLLAAIRDDVATLTQDTNPPAHELLDLVLARTHEGEAT